MRPEEKAFVVEEIQSQGFLVGMVGDGANDCPALKAANIGISLSDAEASLAAPFSSKVFDISCVDILLREGRCLLVTTFQIFKYMAVYSMIQGIAVCILYVPDTFLSNNQFLCEDLFIVLPLAICMSYTRPHDILSRKKPIARLISWPVLISIVGQIIIIAWTQIVMYAITVQQDWYVDLLELNSEVEDYDESLTYSCAAVFIFSIFQYIGTVIAFSVGKPFRKEFWTNWSFCFFLAWVIAECEALLWTDNPDLMVFMSFTPFPDEFKGRIQGFAIGNIAMCWIYEWMVVPWVINCISNSRRCRRKQGHKKITF
jgi:cation-transporting ATPase 13A3/4/5